MYVLDTDICVQLASPKYCLADPGEAYLTTLPRPAK
jgi:hypothetical protein